MKLIAFIIFTFCSGCSAAYAADIQLMWNTPTIREDGSTIQAIDEYRLYETINNAVIPVLSIPASATDYSFTNVINGVHTFQISTVEAGQEGTLSDPVSVNVELSAPAKMNITVTVNVQ